VHADVPRKIVMALVESLLTAIARADGDALVMHVGEKPYVVASAGPIELSAQALTLQAMVGMVAQLLPEGAQRSLADLGAVEHELPGSAEMSDDRFTVVVARGGDDVWIEVRRHRGGAVAPAAPEPSADLSAAPAVSTPEPEVPLEPLAAQSPAFPAPTAATLATAIGESVAPGPVVLPTNQPTEIEVMAEPTLDAPVPDPVVATAPKPSVAELTHAVAHADYAASSDGTYGFAPQEYRSNYGDVAARVARDDQHDVTPAPGHEERARYGDVPSTTTAREEHRSVHEVSAATRDERPGFGDATPIATIIPMTRTLRIDVPPPASLRHAPRAPQIERLLGLASARHATALYLTTEAPPHLRSDAEVSVLDGEPALTAADVEAAAIALMPEASRQAWRNGEAAEWATDVAGIGSVRCATFRDHRGPGAIFQIVSKRPVPAEQLGLPAEVRALATEAEGLVLVAAAPGHGRTTLVGALVDLINKQRSNYVITLERDIRMVHDRQSALVSQRGIREDQQLAAARAALREKPDVLVIDEIASADMLRLALEAADACVLVVAGVTSASTTTAVAQLVELVPRDERRTILSTLAERLRGAVAQVLLRKPGGGRTAAREVLLSTAAVAAALSDDKLADLPAAIEAGRKYGLVTLTESLAHLAKTGAVDLRELYRKSPDRDALVAALKRQNVDIGQLERLA
jgi:twitching motility protein PilT